VIRQVFAAAADRAPFVPDQLVVAFAPSVDAETRRLADRTADATTVRRIEAIAPEVVTIASGREAAGLLSYAQTVPFGRSLLRARVAPPERPRARPARIDVRARRARRLAVRLESPHGSATTLIHVLDSWSEAGDA